MKRRTDAETTRHFLTLLKKTTRRRKFTAAAVSAAVLRPRRATRKLGRRMAHADAVGDDAASVRAGQSDGREAMRRFAGHLDRGEGTLSQA